MFEGIHSGGMNNSAGKTSVSLAIAEKKPQRRRPGGCVGIFFHLFDWNRRAAKKKLFSKKLLPPARAKQPSKKIGGDDRLPKHRLIADENSGGFPIEKKNGARTIDSEQKHKMQKPSLIARLMGLESMPAVKPGNAKKPLSLGRERDMFVTLNNEHGNLEKGSARHEVRPQKLQKTGPGERQPLTRFGTEALQLKNVISRSRKHSPKLASPVKSPRNLYGRNASRWIGAASKILEPGLQAGKRSKHALTYPNAMHHDSKGVDMLEGEKVLAADQSMASRYFASTAKSLKVQSSCRNCGHLVDVMDSRPNEKGGMPLYSPVQESKTDFQNYQELSTSNAAQAIENKKPCSAPISPREPLDQDGQIQWHLKTQICNPQQDISSPYPSKHRTQKYSQLSVGREKVPPRLELGNFQSHRVSSAANTNAQTKDFVALNRNLSVRSRSRMPAKVDNGKFDADRKYCYRQDNSLSPVRKKRTMNSSRENEISGASCSSIGKHGNIMMEKASEGNAHSANHSCVESRFPHLGERSRTSCSTLKDNAVISFSFNSPMPQIVGVPADLEKRHGQNNLGNHSTAMQSSRMDKISGKACFQKPLSLSGDNLGALREQKLKDDDLSTGSGPTKRTTAMILQQIITALTAGRPIPLDDVAVVSNSENVPHQNGHILDTNIFQAKKKKAEASARYIPDNDHLSPGSVLEVSFSNESCFSGSLDCSSGIKCHADSMNYGKWNSPELVDTDLSDSDTSLGKGKTCRELVTNFLNCISEVSYNINLAGTGLNAKAREVILNAELVCGNKSFHKSDKKGDFSISSFLIYELEALASVVWTNCGSLLGFEDTKEGNQFKQFIFDSLIEYLDMKLGEYCISKYPWTLQALHMTSELLMHDVVREVVRWTNMAGLMIDELVEREMSHSLGKWDDYKVEEFETSNDLGNHIFQVLVDEIVVDLWDCRLSC